MANKEKRRTLRIPAEFKVDYVHDDDYVISLSRDISADGMFISTEDPPPVGDTPTLIFSIGELKNVSVQAKVMWVNEKENGRDQGMGVQFIDMPDNLKELILHIINRVAVFDADDGPTN